VTGVGEVKRMDDDTVTWRHGEPRMPASERSAADPVEPVAASPPRRVAVSEVLAWLDARAAAPPPELRARMAAALEAVTSETVPGALAEAALSCLQATMAAPGERASALDLLAADALLTYALEAATEMGAQALRDVVDAYGPSRLGEVIPPGAEP
jgi:hypothetical protein